jgi:hypothetical protein
LWVVRRILDEMLRAVSGDYFRMADYPL